MLGIVALKPTFTILGLVLTATAVWAGFEYQAWILNRKYQAVIPLWAILPAVFMIYLDALGDMLHFYQNITWYDVLAHGLGGVTAAAYMWSWFWQAYHDRVTPHLLWWLTVSSTIAVGAMYEIEEYLEDIITGSHRLGDGFDTANDLLMNTIGAVVIVSSVYVARYHRRRHPTQDRV